MSIFIFQKKWCTYILITIIYKLLYIVAAPLALHIHVVHQHKRLYIFQPIQTHQFLIIQNPYPAYPDQPWKRNSRYVLYNSASSVIYTYFIFFPDHSPSPDHALWAYLNIIAHHRPANLTTMFRSTISVESAIANLHATFFTCQPLHFSNVNANLQHLIGIISICTKLHCTFIIIYFRINVNNSWSTIAINKLNIQNAKHPFILAFTFSNIYPCTKYNSYAIFPTILKGFKKIFLFMEIIQKQIPKPLGSFIISWTKLYIICGAFRIMLICLTPKDKIPITIKKIPVL